jgi:DNA repair exonuclease SbcCD ATPase subunit
MTDKLITRNKAQRGVDQLEAELAELEKNLIPPQTEPEDAPTSPKPADNEPVTREDGEPLNKEEETFKERYSNLRRYAQKKEDELKKKVEELEGKLSTVQSPNPTTKEEVEAWAKNNPKAAAIIRSLATEQATPKSSGVDERLAELEKLSTKLEIERQEAKIRGKHSDFDAIKESNDFHDWAATKTKAVQSMIYDGDADDVIEAINFYKKDKGIKPADPTRDAALAVPRGKTVSQPDLDDTKGRFSESQVKRMSDAEYEKHAAEIETAIRSGNFVFDITGAAR